MSSYFERNGVYYVKVKGTSGKWIARTCETRNRALAKNIAHMIDELGHRGRQSWDLLDAVVTGRLTLSRLYSAYSGNALDDLRDRMNDVDVSPLVEKWLDSLKGHVQVDTVEHYRVHVRSLITRDARFARSELVFERLAEWLAKIEGSAGTRRKYHAAMSSFCRYLVSAGVLRQNPMRDVKAPSAAAPRCRYLEHEEVVSLLDVLEEPYRTIVALLHAGIEVSVALDLKRGDVDLRRREVHARGTKTKARDRWIDIEQWIVPFLRRHMRHLLGTNAPLFPNINRWTMSDKHRAACKSLEIVDYQLRDSRHTYAVRAIRSGAPYEVVARQLGHADTVMVARVYGRFRPNDHEKREWQRIAAANDAKRVAK
ncbi:MAG: tyrosine-type recombinase/integrase [Gemmatimonadota bacterium]|nr:tyrosine-type recombinase/integrase [Gemmatimonadota bacterium]